MPQASSGRNGVLSQHVHARDEDVRERHVVVGEHDHAVTDVVAGGERAELLDQVLAFAVMRVRLAGDQQLHRALGAREDARQPLALVQQEGQPLVGRDPAREPDREGLRVERRGLPREVARVVAALVGLPCQAAANLVDESRSRACARREQFLVGDGRKALPAVGARAVAVAEPRAVESPELGARPGLGVHAVRDVRDRHIGGLDSREERCEHRSRDAPVQPADAVDARRHADAQCGHVEDAGIACHLGSQRQQALEREAGRHPAAAEVARHEITREAVDAGGHRRVRREDGACAHDLQRMLGIDLVLDEAAHALDREEAGVALVHVEYGGLDATGGERLDAADAEQDLLAQPVLAVAAVQAVGDGALGRRIGIHVRVQQEQLDPPDVDAPEPGVQHGTGKRHDGVCEPSAPITGVMGRSAGSSSTNCSCCAPPAVSSWRK